MHSYQSISLEKVIDLKKKASVAFRQKIKEPRGPAGVAKSF